MPKTVPPVQRAIHERPDQRPTTDNGTRQTLFLAHRTDIFVSGLITPILIPHTGDVKRKIGKMTEKSLSSHRRPVSLLMLGSQAGPEDAFLGRRMRFSKECSVTIVVMCFQENLMLRRNLHVSSTKIKQHGSVTIRGFLHFSF
jgi:hypothetical protein